MDPEILSGLAGVVYGLGTLPYLHKIYKGENRPSISSWLVWLVIDVVALAGMWKEGALNGLIISSTFFTLAIVIFSLWRGVWKWERMDTVCIAGSAVGILLWQTSGEAVVAILSCAIVNLVGAVPTVTRAWKDPGGENRVTWTLYWTSCIMTLLSLSEWTVASAAQPISFTIVESAMLFVVWYRTRTESA